MGTYQENGWCSDRPEDGRGEADTHALFACGFEHEGGCLWSRDGVFYGEEAALQRRGTRGNEARSRLKFP
jgi:hypothetical protein